MNREGQVIFLLKVKKHHFKLTNMKETEKKKKIPQPINGAEHT